MRKLKTNSQVWIKDVATSARLFNQILEMAAWLNIEKELTRDSHIAIKPNMGYPFYKPGVTTNPAVIESVIQVLHDVTPHITLVESDGGAYSWPAEQAFAGHGIPNLCKKYGIKAVNLSQEPRVWVETEIERKTIKVELPTLLLYETDYFITMPVPKVHVMTRVSLGFKNQWGCIPDVKRLRNHPQFSHKVLAINKLLNPKLAIFDGGYLLNRSGPMDGDPIKVDLIIGGGVGAASLVCCEIMSIDARKVAHLRLAQKINMMPQAMDDVSLNVETFDPFKREKLYVQRTLINWLALIAFHSNFLTRLLYDSKWANLIHESLYLVRGRPKDFAPKWGLNVRDQADKS
jgi:uncharacterized protein (DUF362 family)